MNHDQTVSRRTILTHVAGATAATLIATTPHIAAAAGERAALRWGIIGTGTRGAFTHIPTMKEAPESELLALCDVSEERLTSAAAKVGHAVATHSDYQKLLANPDINAVVIAVPNLLHREMLLAALQAGKHVLCEKPAGATPADATEMERAAGSAKTTVMFGMQYRNTAKQRKITELLASGKIGKPKYIVQNCSRGDWNLNPNVWQYSDPKLGGKPMNWRFSHAASGGTLNEYSCHYLDLLHGYAGALPERVSCEGGISVYHDGRDTWDHAAVRLSYPGDVVAIHSLCIFGPGRNDLQIFGETGAIEAVGETFRISYPAARGAKGRRSENIEVPEQRTHGVDPAVLTLYQDFLACVKTGKQPDASPARALAASRTCWAAEQSSDRHAEVKWNEIG
jgi:predicted dehydrogenase